MTSSIKGAVIVAIVGMSFALEPAVRGQSAGASGISSSVSSASAPATSGQELAIGSFVCNVFVTEPPFGSGIPEGFLQFGFSGTAGISASRLEISKPLGPAEGLERLCQSRTQEVEALAKQLGCQTGGVDVSTVESEGFRAVNRSFQFVCSLPRDEVIEALGRLWARVLATNS